MKWYLLQTKPNAHSTACAHLKRQGFEVFLPAITRTAQKKGKFLDRKNPLFPGYLFMGTLKESVPWKSINGTRGVSKVVTLDGKYRSVKNNIIEGLKFRCDENEGIQSMDDIVSGDRVKIEQGPFANFICRVDKITDNRRAWVLINLLQQCTKAAISLNNLMKIN